MTRAVGRGWWAVLLTLAMTAVVLAWGRPAMADPPRVTCDGDGASGKRVQLVYVRGNAQADRYPELLPQFQQFAVEVDGLFVEASTRQGTAGGVRHVRYVHDASCVAAVANVVIPQASMANEFTVQAALAERGYDRTDRKYLVWWDRDACGLAFPTADDDSPGPGNAWNSGPHYAMLGAQGGCFGWPASGHELLHTLGAVNGSAPHATSGGHCWDDEDIMCYDDGGIPPGRELTKVCAGAAENQIDCNLDDYFNTNPAPGSYLATHWNVANSEFLIRVPAAATCRAVYTVSSDWGSGFVAQLAITNTGPPTAGWRVGFAFPGNQRVTELWGGAWTPGPDTTVAVRDLSWNADLPTGRAVTIGFRATYTGANPPPTAFTLNGAACT